MFITSTLKQPLSEIESIIHFVANISKADLSKTQINVKNHTGSIAGRAYNGIPRIANAFPEATTLVTLRVGSEFPATNMRYKWIIKKYKGKRWHEKQSTHPYGGKSSPLLEYNTWQEGLIAIAAHEFNHIYQFQNALPKSEIECEKAADIALKKFRESYDASRAA